MLIQAQDAGGAIEPKQNTSSHGRQATCTMDKQGTTTRFGRLMWLVVWWLPVFVPIGGGGCGDSGGVGHLCIGIGIWVALCAP